MQDTEAAEVWLLGSLRSEQDSSSRPVSNTGRVGQTLYSSGSFGEYICAETYFSLTDIHYRPSADVLLLEPVGGQPVIEVL
jgi:hypothetical protein